MIRAEFITGSFVNYTGLERQFVLAAASIHGESDLYVEENLECIDTGDKVLSLGISVCRAGDEFNVELGKKIALGKAIKRRNHAMYATDAGLINNTMVKALLQQEAEYFKVNPGRYITGYDKDAARYKKGKELCEYIQGLSGDAKGAFNFLTEAPNDDIEKLLDAANYMNEKG